MNRKAAAALLALFVAVVPSTWAKGNKSASTAPGSYKDWGPDIDEIQIVSTFNASDYNKIVVAPMDTDDTPLPEKKDNTYEPVKTVLRSATDSFERGIEKGLEKRSMSVTQGSGSSSKGTLLVKTKILEMDPGSRAARYWAGFGAGAARAKVQGEVIDAKSGKVLFRFTQERRSGVGAAGGDYVSLMQRNLHAIGADVAHILERF